MSWRVWRQDDHGHRAEVAVVDTEEEARRLVEGFEALGHKQAYWCEELTAEG